NDAGYFMGSIICVNDAQALGPGDEIIFEVIDGQQRLTTLSLLLAGIYSKLDEAFQSYEPADQQDEDDVASALVNIRAKLTKRKRDGDQAEPGAFAVGRNVFFLRVQPSVQNHNLEDYRYLLCEAGVLDNQPKPKFLRVRQLARAYDYFREQVPDDVPGLLKLLGKINQLMFVQITVGNQSDAFTLFESLNDRGMPLSAMDIIKNKMLAKMEHKFDIDVDDSFERWQAIVAAIPDAKDQERFLRHFYNAFKHREEIKVEKVTRATRSLVIRIYETLINRDAAALFGDLQHAGNIYGSLLQSRFDNPRIARGVAELARISSVPAYQLLLYLLSLDPKYFSEPDFIEKVTDLLCRYFVRRNVTDTPPTRQIDQAMIDVIERSADRLKAGSKLEFNWFVDELAKQARPATLAQFRAALSGDIYGNNSAMARYVLIQVDQFSHSREYRPDLWARDEKDRFIWTIEHVLPQGDKLPRHWIEMIADGDSEKAAEIQQRCAHLLGNLTLSGYNSDLARSPFEKKQKLVKDRSFLGHKINIGYQNLLSLNSLPFSVDERTDSLATAPFWNESMIQARTKMLVEMVVSANLLPGESLH
ncbi:MAG: DUF262 domain-containing protein, partial [Blastocatellia bacterium]|nr:DUF262 domain-containing protein [Blastocatellia bacterium]